VRDQRFLLVQFQLEVFAQEPGQPCLDLLGLGFRPGKPEKVIVGLCRTLDYAGVE
jgi:hypothetical protein